MYLSKETGFYTVWSILRLSFNIYGTVFPVLSVTFAELC